MHPNARFEYYLIRNDFLNGSQKLMESFFRCLQQPTYQSLKDFIDAQRLLLIIGESKEVKRNLTKYIAPHQINNERLLLEVKWLEAHIDYHAGRYQRCCQKLHRLIQDVLRIPTEETRKETQLGRFFLCRIHLLAGKAFRRLHDLFMAKVHLGLAFCYCEKTLQYRQKLEADHYLPPRIRSIYSRLFIDWKERDYAESILKVARQAKKGFFNKDVKKGNRNTQHLFLSELDQLKGRFFSIQDNVTTIKKSKALRRYQSARRQLQYFFEHRPHRRKARMLRLIGFHRADIIFEKVVRNKGVFEKSDLKELATAIKIFQMELSERYLYFGKISHPTIIRANNNLAFTLTLKAKALLCFGGQDGAAKAVLLKALLYLNKADKENIAGGKMDIDHPDGYLNLNQHISTLRRKMEVYEVRYTYAERLNEEKDRCFINLWLLYQSVIETSHFISRKLSTSKVRDEYLRRLHPIQEVIIKVLYDRLQHFTPQARQYRETLEMVFRVFTDSKKFHSWRPYNQKRMRQVDKRDMLPEKRRWVEEFTREMMLMGRNKLRPEQYKVDGKVFKQFMVDAEFFVLDYQKKRLQPDKREDEQFKRNDSPFVDLVPSNGVVVTYFAGHEQLYAFIISDGLTRDTPQAVLKKLTVTPYEDIYRLKQKSKEIQVVIEGILHTKGLGPRVNATNNNWGNDKIAGWEDHPNIKMLTLANELYKGLIQQLNFKVNVKKIILIPDRWMWQNVPFPMLVNHLPDSVVLREETLTFTDIKDCFLGVSYNLSSLPSLANLRAISKRREDVELAAPGQADLLPGNRNLLLTCFHSTDERCVDPANSPSSIDNQCRRSILNIQQKLNIYDRNGNNQVTFFPPGRQIPNVGFQDGIFDAMSRSFFCYFQGHTRLLKEKRIERSLVLHMKNENVTPTADQIKKDPLLYETHEITREEVIGYDLRNVFLAFINACSSATGAEPGVQMPESLYSAFLEAGVRVVLGTEFIVMSSSAEKFAVYFFKNLTSKPGITVGEARRLTILDMLTGPGLCVHPIRWGAYKLMGDMEQCLSSDQLQRFSPT